MHPLQVYTIVPKLPRKLDALWDLAYNYWFAWDDHIQDIFSQIDNTLWRETHKNTVLFLNRVSQPLLEELAGDELFLDRLKVAHDRLRHYMAKETSSIIFPKAASGQPAVAYFSLEYGISHGLPIYSGGLGILAGDHLKSASDLNIPLVGIGLCYQQGYFRQYLTPDGWQQERYPYSDFEQMPLAQATDSEGNPATIHLDLGGRPLAARIWKAQIGRVPLYLLDTNIPENEPELRQITSHLYGGSLEMRLWQEILLGIGGVKALRVLGLEPRVIHMNEGHSAFAGLERIREFMTQHHLPFEAAMELAASSCVFTTHTPVPAGNDRFPPDLLKRYFESYAKDMGLAFKVFLALGREDQRDDAEPLCMTVLALRLSRFNNGVSQLHGHVSREMWKKVWPQYPVEDVPIGAITNGVHGASWVAPDIALLYDRYLGANWREDADCVRVWEKADSISEAELWRTHERLRARLVDYARYRFQNQLRFKGVSHKSIRMASEVLDPEALTVGFARRFATYKRAGLLLRDKERLVKLIANRELPIQFIFAGKAHPQDNEGKKLIQDLIQLCRTPECRDHIVFLEDYDMEVAQYMVQGCDIWLNTPRRPLEACGTSGMKALVNGVLNVSTLDGWWDEAFRQDNSVGWAIGRGEEYEDPEYQDFVESQTLFTILENDILPEFYDRGRGGLPRSWLQKMKLSIKELVPAFSSHRMVENYALQGYLPAYNNYTRLMRDNFAPAQQLAEWRMDIMTKWGKLKIKNIRTGTGGNVHVGQPVDIQAEVFQDGLSPDDMRVEIYSGPVGMEGNFSERFTTAMAPSGEPHNGWQLYKGVLEPREAGRFGFTIRILPDHPLLLDPHALGIIHWAGPDSKA